MNDTVDVGMVIEDLVEGSFIAHVNVVEMWPLAAYQFDAIECFFGGIVKIVDNNDFVICLKQGKSSERSNVAGPATIDSISMLSQAMVS